jgi:CheY-like chemotaxis protein
MTAPKALVVEDDDRIVELIEETLFSLGHQIDSVTNQADAQAKLENNGFDYMLLDLEIPARPHRGGASIECGVNLLRSVRQVHGPAKLPVIIHLVCGACANLRDGCHCDLAHSARARACARACACAPA